ncbi:hydantoinase/oxoprolinase family protein [Nevskia soli]|uniref:hydantoinase/oxoprolinase family protein n=1 Tax=Nevskia soli TaxID=418856 RepID=UPI00068A4307|nr:hydantoinase/oxoprolinase family protein [Nevskia soli]
MKRVAVDIGGTFTDCFVVWDQHYIQSKALTTHHNLSLGFREALAGACASLELDVQEALAQVDSVRYATTLGTNALIERKGPRVALLVTAGFESAVPLSRGRGYGEGLDMRYQQDLPSACRPDALVPIPMIAGVRERLDAAGQVLLPLDEADLRQKIRKLVDRGAQAFVVGLINSVVNPAHERRVEQVLLEEYPEHMLGAMPVVLSHKVAGRKGEYVRLSSAIIDAFLHDVMYHGLSSLELNLRESSYSKPMLVIHNSGGMAQLNSTDALQTIHSGPVAGVSASEHLAEQCGLGNVICTDMGGTSFDIGLVVEGGIKHYDFNPVIERWLVSVPMIHLVTLGAGGGSIVSYDRLHNTVQVGPSSAGSDPGPACYDRGGLQPTVTDSDLLLGYLSPDEYAGGHIKLKSSRARMAVEDKLCEELGCSVVEAAKMIKRRVDANMANGIFQELRSRGYDPRSFTMLAYGGNGPLHACGIANVLGISRILVPPFCSVFSAVGAGNMHQLHIHERSLFMYVYDSNTRKLFADYSGFNAIAGELEASGVQDLLRQGMRREDIRHRLEVDMRYGNQLVQTTVVVPGSRLNSMDEVMDLIRQFSVDYGKRFGKGSEAPEAGIRINTIRSLSYVELDTVQFKDLRPSGNTRPAPPPASIRKCHFVGSAEPLDTRVYDIAQLAIGHLVEAPAVVISPTTTYLVEPGWRLEIGEHGAAWFTRLGAELAPAAKRSVRSAQKITA